jgi:Protein of unknown function (DUF1353)
MGTFTTPLIVTPLDDGLHWRLTADFDFASGTLERIVRVPAEFVTDFASTPRVLWPILPPTGPWGRPSVVHDMLYRYPECITPTVTRIQADRTFREGMIALKIGRLTQRVMYWGVRMGGWRSWNAYRRQNG